MSVDFDWDGLGSKALEGYETDALAWDWDIGLVMVEVGCRLMIEGIQGNDDGAVGGNNRVHVLCDRTERIEEIGNSGCLTLQLCSLWMSGNEVLPGYGTHGR